MPKLSPYLCALLLACGVNDDTPTSEPGETSTGDATTATTAEETTATTAEETTAATADGCGAQVLIAFYDDAECQNQRGMRVYDTGLDCFSWTAAGSKAKENSATRFQCYADRLCYTQHPNSHTCEDGGFGRTDKQAMLNTCLKEPEGVLYSKLIGGTEACPPAPEGFECPLSAPREGTDGIAACGG